MENDSLAPSQAGTGAVIRRSFSNASIIKELMHYSLMPNSPQYVKDSILLHLLCLISLSDNTSSNITLASDIYEWTRINSSASLTVRKIADHFGYNYEYISRVIKKQYGITLKELVNNFILEKARNYLSNSGLSIKEIANLLGFGSPNTFVKFYKYHEAISPSQFRNQHFYTYMNNT